MYDVGSQSILGFEVKSKSEIIFRKFSLNGEHFREFPGTSSEISEVLEISSRETLPDFPSLLTDFFLLPTDFTHFQEFQNKNRRLFTHTLVKNAQVLFL